MKDTGEMTGDILTGKGNETELGHIIAHIEHAREIFEIKSGWSRPLGLEYSDLFSSSVTNMAREIDMRWSPSQDIMYRNTPIHEPIYEDESVYCSKWPRNDFTNIQQQIWSWTTIFEYLVRDCAISYGGKAASANNKQDRDRYSFLSYQLWDIYIRYEQDRVVCATRDNRIQDYKMSDLLIGNKKLTVKMLDDGVIQVMFIDIRLTSLVGTGSTLKKAIDDLWLKHYKYLEEAQEEH